MNVVNFNERTREKYRRYFDAYLDNELPIETRQEVLQHEVAGFESGKYMAYVISNLDRASNLDVASVMAPVVYSHLHRLEL